MSHKAIELPELLSSKVYVKGDGSIQFQSARQYMEPFMEAFSEGPVEFKVGVAGAVVNAEENQKENVAYGRVLIEAHLPDSGLADHSQGVIGMVYGLDLQKPTVKVFSGQHVFACTNMCVSGAEFMFKADILGNGMKEAYKYARQYIDEKQKEITAYKNLKEKLENKSLPINEVDRMFGRMLHLCRHNGIGTTAVLAANELVFDPKSKYAITEDRTTGWNIYNAFTDHLTVKADILDRPTKLALLSEVFSN